MIRHIKRWKIAAIIVVIAAVVALVWVAIAQIGSSPSVPSVGNTTSTAKGTASSSATPTSSSAQKSSGSSRVTVPSSAATPSTGAAVSGGSSAASQGSSLFITSPTAGAQWVYREPHTISWNRPAGARNGAIYIVNASNGAIVGWILGNIDLNQSSFVWNTQSVYTSRTGSNVKDLSAGKYVIKVTFDLPGEPTISSAPFYIVTASPSAPPAYSFSIKDGAITPAAVTVPQGDRLIFVNADNAAYQMQVSNGNAFTIPNLSQYTFSTANLAKGVYIFSSTKYPNLKTTVTVQ